MTTLKGAVLLCMLAAAQAASFLALEKKSANAAKRQAENYKYPLPVITFPDSNPQKIYIETIKSLTSGQRYLPPTGAGPTISSAPALKPISVSFNAYEAPAQSAQNSPKPAAAPTQSAQNAPKPAAAPATQTASSPTATPSAAPASTAVTPARKRPSGGLGGFKYYGGSGASSSNSKSENSAAAAAPASTSAPVQPAPVVVPKPVQEIANDKPVVKVPKTPGYDYPSPKNVRKPSKKEQKLADSKPEESGTGYRYEVGLPQIASGGVSGTVHGSSGGMMGLSYMRQSSPYYSYHVMLD